MARVFMERVGGWRIEFDQEQGSFFGIPPSKDGRPSWETNALVLKRRDLPALRREIAKRSMGEVQLMHIAWLQPGRQNTPTIPQVITVAGMEGDRVRLKNGQLERNWRLYAVYDDEVINRVAGFKNRMDGARKAIQDEYEAYLATLDLKPLTADQIRELLAASKNGAEPEAVAE